MYTLTPKEGCWHEITGTIPQDEVREEYAHALKEVSKQAPVIPGFRRGKAPREVIIARHGSEIKEHCVNHLVNAVLGKEFEARKLQPVSNPDLATLDWDGTPEGAFSFVVRFETAPLIAPKGLDALTIPDLKLEVSEKEVDDALLSIRRRQGKLNIIEDGAALPGYIVVAELTGVENNPAKGAQAIELPAKEHWIKLPDAGDPQRADNDLFGPALLGIKPGETKSFPVTYPKEADPVLSGKTFTMTAKAKKIYHEELPPLNDDFAKLAKFESLAALRVKMREQVEAEKANTIEDAQQGAILQQLRQINPAPLPEGMVQRELRSRLEQTIRNLAAQGLDPESAKEQWQELMKSEEASTRMAIHNTLLLDAIAEQEGIYPSEEKINDNLAKRAKLMGKNPETLRAELERSGELEIIGYSMRRQETLQQLAARAKKVPPPGAK